MSKYDSLVTGGSGFIGSHLVKVLVEKGHRVRVLDKRIPGENMRHLDIDFVQGDILDRQLVSKLMTGVEQVFHLAAIPDLWVEDKKLFMMINREGTSIVLDAAIQARVPRIIFTSTESILTGSDITEEGGIIDGSLRPVPKHAAGPYTLSKIYAEQEAWRRIMAGHPVIIVTPTVPIGANDWRLTPPTRMMCDFLNGKYPAFFDFPINLVDVGDVAQGHWLAAESGAIGKRYIIGGENIRFSELLRLVESLSGIEMPVWKVPYPLACISAYFSECAAFFSGKPPAATIEGIRLARRGLVFNNNQVKKELGLKFTPLQTSLTRLINWLYQAGFIRREPKCLASKTMAATGRVSSL